MAKADKRPVDRPSDAEVSEIYGLYDPRTNSLRYIGKASCSARRLKGHLRDSERRNTPVYQWIRELRQLGLVPDMKVLEKAADWIEAEHRLIAVSRARGDDLLNLAHGGNQPFCPRNVAQQNGRKNAKAIHSDPERKRIWRLKRGLGQGLRDGHVSERVKANMRIAARKRPDLFGEWANLK